MEKPVKALRRVGEKKKLGKHDVIFMLSTRFKRKQRDSKGEKGESLCNRQSQLHNLQGPVRNENAGPLVHKTGRKLSPPFPRPSLNQPRCFLLAV